MKFSVFLLGPAAISAPAAYDTENLVTERVIKWELNMDSVMGGSSTGKNGTFSGRISLNNEP